jgi:hypothetical protein
MSKKHTPNTASIDSETAAQLAGVTRRRVDQLVTGGQLARAKTGAVTVESLAAYLGTQRAGGSELEAERVLLVRAQRRLVNQRRLRAAGALLDAATVHSFLAGMLTETRSAFMNCGATLAPICARAGSQHEIAALIDTELEGICARLSAKAGQPIEETDSPNDTDDDLEDDDAA